LLSIIDEIVLRDVVTAKEQGRENKAGERVIDEMKEEEKKKETARRVYSTSLYVDDDLY